MSYSTIINNEDNGSSPGAQEENNLEESNMSEVVEEQVDNDYQLKIDLNSSLLMNLNDKVYEDDFDVKITNLEVFRSFFLKNELYFLKKNVEILDFLRYLAYNIKIDFSNLLLMKVDDISLRNVYLKLIDKSLINYSNNYIVSLNDINKILALLCNVDINDLISKMNLKPVQDIIVDYLDRVKDNLQNNIYGIDYRGELQDNLDKFNLTIKNKDYNSNQQDVHDEDSNIIIHQHTRNVFENMTLRIIKHQDKKLVLSLNGRIKLIQPFYLILNIENVTFCNHSFEDDERRIRIIIEPKSNDLNEEIILETNDKIEKLIFNFVDMF